MRRLASILFLIVNFMVWGALAELHLPFGFLATLAITAFLAFFAILFHELGHAFAVRRTGGTITAIMVAPFKLRFNPTRIELAPPPARRGDIGGYVAYSPGWDRSIRSHVVIAAAGPAANLVSAVIAILISLSLPGLVASTVNLHPLVVAPADRASSSAPRPAVLLPSDVEVRDSLAWEAWWGRSRTAAQLAIAFAILSTGMGLCNLIPFENSDGMAIRKAIMRRRRAGL